MKTSEVSFQSVVPLRLAASLLFLATCLPACQTSTEDLDAHIQNEEVEKVSQFAADNLSLDDTDPRVVYAIQLLSDVQADTALTRLATLISQPTPSGHTEALITELLEREIERENGFYLCEIAVEGNLPAGDVTNAYLSQQGGQKLAECVVASVSVSDAIDSPDRIISALDELAKIADVGDDLQTVKSTAERFAETRASLQDIEREVSELQEEKDDVEETLDVIREDLDDIQMLTAFVVGRQERVQNGELYEIALPDGFGRPSSQHAYLFTKETQFTTKGRFTMPVVREENVDTRLRNEYGGFMQSWPFFVESTNHSILQSLLQSGMERQREIDADFRSSSQQQRRLTRKERQFKRELKNQIRAVTEGSDLHTSQGTSGAVSVVRVDDRTLPVAGTVSVDNDRILHLVRDESESVWRLKEARNGVQLDATFSLNTAIGPFHPATQRDGVYFRTADGSWITYHYWNPENNLHLWQSQDRLSGRTGHSSNVQSHPSIASQLKRRPDPSLDRLVTNTYSEARRTILTSGWTPVEGDYESYSMSAVRTMADNGWIEVQSCAGSGVRPCRFEFERPTGEKLVVITEGESEDPSVRSIFTED